jgi:hypothetical protein
VRKSDPIPPVLHPFYVFVKAANVLQTYLSHQHGLHINEITGEKLLKEPAGGGGRGTVGVAEVPSKGISGFIDDN